MRPEEPYCVHYRYPRHAGIASTAGSLLANLVDGLRATCCPTSSTAELERRHVYCIICLTLEHLSVLCFPAGTPAVI
jgi:hypothetical protein